MELPLPTLDDGAGLVLRPIDERDAPAYAAAFRDDPDLGRIVGVELDPSEDDVLERISNSAEGAAAGHFVELAVTEAGDAFLGTVIVHSIAGPHRRCELGYWLVPGARGRGIGRRAVGLLARWLFDELGMERLELTTFPDNAAAIGLARSLGFVEEGLMRKRNLERGVRVDLLLFGLLREDRRD